MRILNRQPGIRRPRALCRIKIRTVSPPAPNVINAPELGTDPDIRVPLYVHANFVDHVCRRCTP